MLRRPSGFGARRSRLTNLSLNRSIDIPVRPVFTDAVNKAVAPEKLVDRWLYPSETESYAGLLCELEDLAHLGGTLRIDEVDSLAVKDNPADARR